MRRIVELSANGARRHVDLDSEDRPCARALCVGAPYGRLRLLSTAARELTPRQLTSQVRLAADPIPPPGGAIGCEPNPRERALQATCNVGPPNTFGRRAFYALRSWDRRHRAGRPRILAEREDRHWTPLGWLFQSPSPPSPSCRSHSRPGATVVGPGDELGVGRGDSPCWRFFALGRGSATAFRAMTRQEPDPSLPEEPLTGAKSAQSTKRSMAFAIASGCSHVTCADMLDLDVLGSSDFPEVGVSMPPCAPARAR
jgi:hypothetical protein